MSAYPPYSPPLIGGQPGNAYYPMATSPTMQSSTMPTYTMPTGTVPTTTITMSGHAPAYSAPTYAYASPVTHVTRVVERPQIVEREIVLPPEAPPVQHVRHVVYQEVEPQWQEPPYDPAYRTLAERFPLMKASSPQRDEEEMDFGKEKKKAQRTAAPAKEPEPEPDEEVETKKKKNKAQRSAAPGGPIIQDRIVEKEVLVDKIVEIQVPVEVERIVEREVVIEREVEKIIEIPVTTEKRVEVAVPYERVVHIQVPVEKIVYKDVPVPVQMNPVREVTKEIPRPYEVIKEVPQHYERTVIKEILVPMERVQHFVEQDEVIVRKEIKTHRNVVGEELRPAQLTQETLAEAQRLRSPKVTSSEPVPIAAPQGFMYNTLQGPGNGNGLYSTANGRMSPAYSPNSAGPYGSSVVRTGSPAVASPNRVGASFTNYGSPVRAVSPQLASRTSLSPGTLQAGSGAYRRL